MGKNNLTKLSTLRDQTGLDRATFDASLRRLRLRSKVSLNSFEGHTGTLTDHERAAAIREGNSVLAYAARRKRR